MDIIFDMDGVIIDSSISVINRIKQVAQVFRFDISNKDLKKYIGYSPESTFTDLSESYKFNTAYEVLEAAELYIKLFWERPIEEAVVYPGILKEIQDLIIRYGSMLYIVTGRPLSATTAILKHYNLVKYFSIIESASNRNKSIVVKELINHYELNKDDCYLIGDRDIDIKAAIDNKIIPIGAAWGFGGAEELMEAGAKCIVETPSKLIDGILFVKEEMEE